MFAVFTFNTNFNFRQVKKQKNPLMQICKKSKTTQIDADNSLEKQTLELEIVWLLNLLSITSLLSDIHSLLSGFYKSSLKIRG